VNHHNEAFVSSKFHKMSIANIDLQTIIMNTMFIQLLGLTFHSRLENMWLLNLISIKQPQKQNKTTQIKQSSFLSSDYSERADGGEVWGQFVDLSDEKNKTQSAVTQ